MPQIRSVALWALLLRGLPVWIGALAAVGPPIALAQDRPGVDALIVQLGSVDPQEREQAGERLARLGERARPAIERARQSDDPEIRQRATKLMLQLRWDRAPDPEPVRQLLSRYGQQGISARQATVGRLAGAPPAGAEKRAGDEKLSDDQRWSVLVRLLREDPSDQVGWTITRHLSPRRNSRALEPLRDDPTEGERAPLLAARGWAMLGRDQARAVRLLRQSVDRDARDPARDGGQLPMVLHFLQQYASSRGDYGTAADLLRHEILRAPGQNAPIFRLLALHAEHGPLSGYTKDVHRYASRLDPALRAYAQSVLLRRQGHPEMAQLLVLGAAARHTHTAHTHTAHTHTAPEPFEAGTLLADSGWLDLAQLELTTALTIHVQTPTLDAINPRILLATLAERRKDDQAFALHMRVAMEQLGRLGGTVRFAGEDGDPVGVDESTRRVWARIFYHSFRAARARGDQALALKELDRLLELEPSSGDLALDLVGVLKEMDRTDEAREVFERAYARAKRALDATPDDPDALNGLAWTCARSGERLDEALRAAQRAARFLPDNPAYLDTLAEVHFRRGEWERAVELEKKALALQPGDPFMLEQLERFKTGAPASPRPAP